MTSTDFGKHLATFLTQYLPGQRGVGENTIRSYRDVFVLLLRYCRDERGWPPEKLCLKKLNDAVIMEFLEYLQEKRGSSIRTRNHRLAALHSFFRYLQTEVPECLLQCQRILAIPSHRYPRRAIRYLLPDDLAFILAQPDRETSLGRRDVVLLSLLYDSGARAQEIIDLRPHDIRTESPAHVRLTGKGRKERLVPLMPKTVKLVSVYLGEQDLSAKQGQDRPLFTNRRGEKLSRSGVRYIVTKYVKRARGIRPDLPGSISPHTFRHTKAMHLLECQNPLVIIRDFLGHQDIRATEVYARASLEMKRDALEKAEKVSPNPAPPASPWRPSKELLDWLRAL